MRKIHESNLWMSTNNILLSSATFTVFFREECLGEESFVSNWIVALLMGKKKKKNIIIRKNLDCQILSY